MTTWLLCWSATRAVALTSQWWNAPSFYPASGVLAFPEHLLGLVPIAAPGPLSDQRSTRPCGDGVVVIFFAGVFGLARSFKCSSIFRRGTPFTIQSGAGAPIR